MASESVSSINVVVKTWDGRSSKKGNVSVESWEKPERLRRAIKTLGLGWGLAFISIFLPGAHFFLVPGFFVGGPVAAYLVSRQRSVVLGGEGICPNCGAKLIIVRGPVQWPLEDVCTQCQNHVRIEEDTS